jgi:hypothetical protein
MVYPLPTLMGFSTIVDHYVFYDPMDQIHLNPPMDLIQLALGHISNSLPPALESTMQVHPYSTSNPLSV